MSRFLLKKWMTILLSGLFSEANLRVVNSASHCSSNSGGTPKSRVRLSSHASDTLP